MPNQMPSPHTNPREANSPTTGPTDGPTTGLTDGPTTGLTDGPTTGPTDEPSTPHSEPSVPYGQQRVEIEDKSAPDQVVISSPTPDWNSLVQDELVQLNGLNAAIREEVRLFQEYSSSLLAAQNKQRRLLMDLSESRNEVHQVVEMAHLPDIPVTQMQGYPAPVFLPPYNERNLNQCKQVCDFARTRIAYFKQINLHLNSQLVDFERENRRYQQELEENLVENARLANFKNHLKAIRLVKTDKKRLNEVILGLEPLSEPIKRFSKSEYQGTPNIDGITLISLAAHQANIDAISQLYTLGYSLIKTHSEHEDPLSLMQANSITVLLNKMGSRLKSIEIEAIYEVFLNITLKDQQLLSPEHIEIFQYFMSHGWCKSKSEIFKNVLLSDSYLPVELRVEGALSYFKNYQSFVLLQDQERGIFIHLIFQSLTRDTISNTLENIYINNRRLHALMLIADLTAIGQKDLALDIISASKVAFDQVDNELLNMAYQLYAQGNESMLANAMEHNKYQVQQWFKSLPKNSQGYVQRFALICFNVSSIPSSDIEWTFKCYQTKNFSHDFSLLFKQVLKHDLDSSDKILTSFILEQAAVCEDVHELMRIQQMVKSQVAVDQHNNLGIPPILKIIKNRILELAIEKPERLEIDGVKTFLESHRTQGWSCFCGALYIPPTLFATPSSKVYDAIVSQKRELAHELLEKEIINTEKMMPK